MAVSVNSENAHSWVQLGKAHLYSLHMAHAADAFEVAVVQLGARDEMHNLFKVRNWVANWRDREDMLDEIQDFIERNLGRATANINALDFIDLSPPVLLSLSMQPAQVALDINSKKPSMCCSDDSDASVTHLQSPELRIGFVSSDFGVHPVSALMRGLLQFLTGPDHPAIVVYCFSLTDKPSWWRTNISQTADHMVSLSGQNPFEGAAIIRSHNVHVLIDLNGHTLHSGLPIFAHRPSPVQMSFLGYPMTTANAAIDYFVSDAVSTPAETSSPLFTEKLLLLPTHYIVNDHMQMLGHTIDGGQPALIPDDGPPAGGDTGVFVFATFSNWQKMDPRIFRAWMHILARVPNSVFWFLRFPGHEDATRNLRQEAKAHGIDGDKRLVFSKMVPWIEHTHAKRAADLILDTALKNGHTTMLDALMAGVPVVTLEGSRMSTRAGSSALESLDLHEFVVNSYKEYVEVAVQLATNPDLMRRARAHVEAKRLQFPLFDTRKFAHNFEAALKSSWTVKAATRSTANSLAASAGFHIFPAQRQMQLAPRKFPVLSGASVASAHIDATRVSDTVTPWNPRAKEEDVRAGDAMSEVKATHTRDREDAASRVTAALTANEDIRLHIGGLVVKEGWWIIDADAKRHDNVDFQLQMHDLHLFPNHSVVALYASHVLEHCHYLLNNEVELTLREWHRVLRPDGELFVSVPDLLVLSQLFANSTTTDEERVFLTRVLYGGQVDAFDVHKAGFFSPLLESWLVETGFCAVERVVDFGLFHDTSTMAIKGVPISLNVKAQACAHESNRDRQ